MSSEAHPEGSLMDYMEQQGLGGIHKPGIVENGQGNGANGKNGDEAPPAAKRNKVWITVFSNIKEVVLLVLIFEFFKCI